MGEPVVKDEPSTSQEDEEDNIAVRSKRLKRATARLNYRALEAFSTSEESEDDSYEPDTDARSDSSSNDECVSDDGDSQKASANRSDGLGDLLLEYQEAYKVAVCGVPSSSADHPSKRAKMSPKVVPTLSPDYYQHFTDKLQSINELNQSISTTEKLTKERRLAIQFLKHRADSDHVGSALKELHEIGSLLKSFGVTNVHTSHDYLKDMQDRVDKMRNEDQLTNSGQLDQLDGENSEEADSPERSD
ncbi:hypothetical protein TTRE_0000307201 [Trichuris trichiura]|uniref:Uncharacterized protein n=1 Tax=Trichuris trichiura TaxID=36087 RepID=A0A077Z2U8_TRITR|nr:hypothetical protein TTRE_0000307201 [Trichuris trichiura]